MRRSIVIILLLVVVAVVAWMILKKPAQKEEGPKQQALGLSKHSDKFNDSITTILDSYYALTDAFVNWDSTKVNTVAADLKSKMDTFQMAELKDSAVLYETAKSFLDNSKGDVTNIETAADITAKRRSLNSLTENLYNYLRVIRYDKGKLFLQECPMAFNDEEPGDWLSKTAEIRNPYLGLHHPRYGKGMIGCGETKDTLNFTESK